MSVANRKIELLWKENFKKSPLVDSESGLFREQYARQLFYGKTEDFYPTDYPHNFSDFFLSREKYNQAETIEKMLVYLDFIGINMRPGILNLHLEKFPDDYQKFIRMCYYIFKTLAHYGDNLDADNPFKDLSNDIFFLLRIESEESTLGGQLNLFVETELPNLYSRLSHLPEGYENNEVVKSLYKQIEFSNDCFFITGKAGTGKSTFIHYFAQKTKKKVVMLAFTGIAAINVGGQTIHSFFRFPIKPLMPEDDEVFRFKHNTEKYKVIKGTDTFIIDEVSMLRADILQGIDYSLRINGGDLNKPFGGKQILFIGDIFQLPPVVNLTNEVDKFLFTEIYKSEYFFDSLAYKEHAPAYFEFQKSYRQKDDLEFVTILDEVRICKPSNTSLRLLNNRYDANYIPKMDEFVIFLMANNAIANSENQKRLSELPFTKFLFEAKITGEFREDRYPTAKSLELKKNAQVIFIKNDATQRWVNGTIAKVDFISNDILEIRLQNGETHKLEPVTWENRKYTYHKDNRRIASEVVGTFTQYPIKLAWAITIHKSQGLSFDNVVIDLGSGAFVNGQVYTALSRCRTLDGIVLKRMLKQTDIIADKRVLHFYETERLIDQITSEQDESKEQEF